MRWTVRVAAVVATLLLLTGCGADEEPAVKRLPDLTLPSLTGGDPVALRSLRGPLVINVWASWCTPCKRELPIYAAFAKKHTDVQVLGIDYQDQRDDAAIAMLRKAGADYPVVKDFDGDTRSFAVPKLTLVDEDGHVVHEVFVEITSLGQLEGIVAEHLGTS